jgi:hypothetical protein
MLMELWIGLRFFNFLVFLMQCIILWNFNYFTDGCYFKKIYYLFDFPKMLECVDLFINLYLKIHKNRLPMFFRVKINYLE